MGLALGLDDGQGIDDLGGVILIEWREHYGISGTVQAPDGQVVAAQHCNDLVIGAQSEPSHFPLPVQGRPVSGLSSHWSSIADMLPIRKSSERLSGLILLMIAS